MKNIFRSLFSALILIALVAACSSPAKHVMPGENGINRITIHDANKHNGMEDAIEGANEYCKLKGKQAIFIENKEQYKGKMDEGTRDTVRNISKAAMIAGPVAGAISPFRHHKLLGPAAGVAGVVGYTMTSDKDYETFVKFKCE